MAPDLVTALTVLAATGSNSALTIEGILLNLGLPGVVIIALAVYAKNKDKIAEERNRRLEDDNRRLYQIMTDQMIPALTKANDTMVNAATLMADIKNREERQAAIEEARRALEEDQRKRGERV